MIITARELRAKGAQCKQVATFEKEWGEGAVEVNLPNLLRAAELELDFDWFAEYCLPEALWERYCAEETPLWARYWAEEYPFWACHGAKADSIWERYRAEVARLIDRLVNNVEARLPKDLKGMALDFTGDMESGE